MNNLGSFWERYYDLSLVVHRELAEVEYLNGNFENSERLINNILEHAKTDIEKGEIYRLLIVQYTLSAKYPLAIDALKNPLLHLIFFFLIQIWMLLLEKSWSFLNLILVIRKLIRFIMSLK